MTCTEFNNYVEGEKELLKMVESTERYEWAKKSVTENVVFQQSVGGLDEKIKNEQKFILIDENGSENQISSYISTKLLSLVNSKCFHACFICYTIFCKSKSYTQHLKQCKPVINLSTCTDSAGVKLSTLVEFPQQAQFKCLKCKKLLPSKEVLLTHYKTCLIYNCVECNKQFASEGTLKIHFLTKHCEDNQSLQNKHEFTCESCSKEYLDSLESIYAYYPKLKKIMCNNCKWDSTSPPCSPKSLLIENTHVEVISSDSDTSVARSIPEPIPTDNLHLSADIRRRRIFKSVKKIDVSQIQKNATPACNALLQYESKIDELFKVISLKEFKTGKCCRICEIRFRSVVYLKRHYRKFHSLHSVLKIPLAHVCTCCVSKCATFKQIGHHLYENHVPFFKCKYCDFTFCSMKDRTRHKEESHSEICRYCTVTVMRSKEEKREHLTWHLTEESIRCETCDKILTGIRKLKVHQLNHRRQKTTKGLCVQCGKVVNDLRRHIYNTHRKKLCLTCGKLLSESVYQYHTKVLHRNFKNASVQCPTCGKMQKSYKHFYLHRRMVHEKHLFVQCPNCPKTFPFPHKLKQHLASCSDGSSKVVSTVKSVKCDTCGELFKSENILTKHLRNEHGKVVRRFACHHCPHTFIRNDARVSHERIHTGERPYSCSVCGQRFRQITDCKRHEDRHSGKTLPRPKKGKTKTSAVCEVGEDLGYYVEYEKLPDDSKFQRSVDGLDEKKQNIQIFILVDVDGSESQISSCISSKLLTLANAKHFHACFNCHKIFSSSLMHTNHLKQCNLASTSTSTDLGDDDIKLSVLAKLPHKQPFKCVKCKALFLSEEVLLTHYKSCLIYNCVECIKQFASEGTLKIHFLTKHCEGNQNLLRKHDFTCESCSKEYLESLESIYAYYPKYNKIMCNDCKLSICPSDKGLNPTNVISAPSSSALQANPIQLPIKKTLSTGILSSDSDNSMPASIPEAEPFYSEVPIIWPDAPRRKLKTKKTSKKLGKKKRSKKKRDLSFVPAEGTPTSNALLKYESKINALFEEMTLKTFKKNYNCRVCGAQYRSLLCLKRHNRKCTAARKVLFVPTTHACVLCKSKCTSLKEISQHLYNSHVPHLKCNHCNLLLCTGIERTEHMKLSHVEFSQCRFCSKMLNSNEEKKKHISWHLTEESVKCDTCNRMYLGIRKLKIHQREHTKKLKRTKGLCGQCGKEVNDLTRHLKRTHRKKLCLTCGKLLSHSVYNYHKNVLHKNYLNTAVQCSACGKMQKSYKHLDQHRRAVHEKHLYVQCPTCPKKFPYPYHLRKHLEARKCGILTTCETCGESFKSDYQLVLHLRKMHGKVVRRFACQYCPDTFFRNDARLSHERIHTGERPYSCTTCGQRFRVLIDCKRHEDRHAGKVVPKQPKKVRHHTPRDSVVEEVNEDLGYFVEFEPNQKKLDDM